MVVFPNCKINIGLRVTGKRPDGFHDLETIFYPVPLFDVLEAVPSNQDSFSQSGIIIPGDDNICVQARDLFRKNYDTPPLSIHLHKTIPAGAGLGGGSSDGAFMLKLLSSFAASRPTDEILKKMALQLGSDCPFFLENKPAYATGRGENLNAINLDLAGYYLVIVNPGIHISTREAFTGLETYSESGSLSQTTTTKVADWKEVIINDFEKTVFRRYPELMEIKRTLYDAGADYASMTGTGSTIFGLFRFEHRPTFPEPWFVKTLKL